MCFEMISSWIQLWLEDALYISSYWLMALLGSILLLTFCSIVLSIVERRLLTSSTMCIWLVNLLVPVVFALQRFCISVVWCLYNYPPCLRFTQLLESIFHISCESWDVFSHYLFGNLSSLSSFSSPLETPMI